MKVLKLLCLCALVLLCMPAKGVVKISNVVVRSQYLDGGAIKINRSSTAELKTNFIIDVTVTRDAPTSGHWEDVNLYLQVCAIYPLNNGGFDVVPFEATPNIRFTNTDFTSTMPGQTTKSFTISVVANEQLLNTRNFTQIGIFYNTGAPPPYDLNHWLNTSYGSFKIKYVEGGSGGTPTDPPVNPPPAPILPYPTVANFTTFRLYSTERVETAGMPESNGTPIVAPDNVVMTGRRHIGDENDDTWYEYGKLSTLDGTPGVITIDSKYWTGWQNQADQNFTAPAGYVITGRHHTGDENGDTRYQVGIVRFNGYPCNVNVSPYYADKVTFQESSGAWYKAPEGAVWIHMSHLGDEKKNTHYTHAKIEASIPAVGPGTPPVPGSLPLYAYYNTSRKDWYYDIIYYPEGTGNGDWKYKGIICYVFPGAANPGLQTPVYSYFNDKAIDHFYSTQFATTLGAGSYKFEKLKFYATSSAATLSGVVPIFLYTAADNSKHALSQHVGVEAELVPGVKYYMENIAFFAIP